MVKALFLDRDGVINIDKGYVHTITDFEFVPGVFTFCRDAIDKGYMIIVVTNQSGIARGYYNEEAFAELTDWMCQEFQKKGVHIEAVYFCPHHPTAGKGRYLSACECRKPNPGMLLQAINEKKIKATASLLIGDSQSDIDAAEKAGIKAIKVVSGSAPFACLTQFLK